ncbi:MAG: thioredoxin family protein [Muribaculaceae bacterium]|nr:thioredoxin family protein [Muribaculaceae bacterium]
MKKLYFLLISLVCLCGFSAAGQVTWSYNIKGDNTEHPALEITADIAPGYHLYSMDTEAGSQLEFYFSFKGAKANGHPVADKAYKSEYNDIFEANEHYYTGKVTFTQNITPIDEHFTASLEIKGQVCNDQSCYQLSDSHKFSGKAVIKGDAEDSPELTETTEEDSDINSVLPDTIMTKNSSDISDNIHPESSWWDNVEAEMTAFSNAPQQQEQSLWYIFIAGFIGGLIALVTPCVWPLIPMTVSFFLKQNKSKRKAVTSAIIYGVSIIVIYVALGLLVTIIFGASALNELATSAGFNIAFFILLVIFAISFMGGFELTLPSSWSNKIDSKVDSTSGFLSIFFMAFTLALVSFSCTGPIIGTLLVEAAATSNFVSPAVGMFGFALALALPFSLFAIFPTMLKSMPKSGGWMNTVKVVLGFLELALALKFLSVADLAYGWRILDREVFVALWIVIFALLGVYLLGKITFPHDEKVEKVGIVRFMLATVSLAFAVYMLPGLWGAPLKSISAFTPPMSTQDFNLYDGSVHAQVNDFEEGMKLAEKLDKPVLLDFSGYGCVNCRKMEAAVWTDPAVKSKIDNDFILVTLMVDDKNPLPEPIKVVEKDGKERTLRTYGDKWSYLERTKFGANAQPYHVIVDKDAKPLSPAFVYKEDIPAYMDFLNKGAKNFNIKDK